MANAWKIAPGEGAFEWEMCRQKGCILIGWRDLKDYRKYKSEKQILKALGGGPGDGTGAAKSIWRFVHDIQLNDVVIANKGRSSVVGVGIVDSDYLPPKSSKNPSESEWLPNARLVHWVIDQPIDLEPCFFGMHTVHSLNVEKLSQIKQAYLKKYPKLKKTLKDLFDGVEAIPHGGREGGQIDWKRQEKEQAKGQGFLRDKKLQLALEQYAMDVAKIYFKSSGFVWEDHSKKHPYDLYCRRGKQELYVEVKGTQTEGEQIILTSGEVDFARSHKRKMALFVLHSIKVSEDGEDFRLQKGEKRLISPWDVDHGCLSPLSFMYRT